MEEVDKIILDSLRHLDCDIPDDIENLRKFDADMVASAISFCLEAIVQNVGAFPKKLPPSMSARLKIASSLAEQIKDLGFHGDIGYQTILYCNEEEVRRVLMFLIERLPRETAKNVPIEQVGYVPRIVKSLSENIKEHLSKPWVPSCFLRQGVRECVKGYTVHSMGNNYPLKSEKLDIPSSKLQSEDLKHYWINFVPEVTKQCSSKKFIPSLLFHDNEIAEDFDLQNVVKKSVVLSVDSIDTKTGFPLSTEKVNSALAEKVVGEINVDTSESNMIEKLSQQLEEMKIQYLELQENVKRKESQLLELIRVKNEEQDQLKETLAKVQLKTKMATVLSKDENLAKLNNMIQNANDRLAELAKQWNEIQTPLLEEYRLLKNNLTKEESKFQEQKEKLENLKDTEIKLQEDLKEKKHLSQNLLQQYQQISSSTNKRTMYTRRILEIIGNINKQNNDIQKVLKDTRQIQKDIKNLTGQVDRSFTLADELIFYDAKHDETARRSYKLLAALRDEFSSILKTLEDLGVVERECRNLEEQIEVEKSKDIASKLDRVYSDLKQIQKETQMLKEQCKR